MLTMLSPGPSAAGAAPPRSAAAQGLDDPTADGARPVEAQLRETFIDLDFATLRESLRGLDPSDPLRLYFAGRLALWHGDLARAEELAGQCLDLDGDHSVCHELYGEARSLVLLDGGPFERFGGAIETRRHWQRAVALDPRNLRARMLLLRFHRQSPFIVGGTTAKARAHEAAIRRWDPDRGREAEAVNAWFDGEDEAALQGFRYAREQEVSPDARYYITLPASRLDHHRRTIEAFARIVRTAPDNWDGWFRGGYAELPWLGDRRLSQETLVEAAETVPETNVRATALYAYGRMLERLGETASARAAYRAAMATDADHERAEEALARL